MDHNRAIASASTRHVPYLPPVAPLLANLLADDRDVVVSSRPPETARLDLGHPAQSGHPIVMSRQPQHKGPQPSSPAPTSPYGQGSSQGLSPSASSASGAPRESASYGRRRAVTACNVCRIRKTKCDNQRPICGFCTSTGGACGYPDDTPADHSKLDRGSLAILQRLGEMEKTLSELLTENKKGSQGLYEHQQSFMPDMTSDAPPSAVAGYASHNHPPAADVVTRSSEMRVENILQWPIFHNSGSHPPTLANHTAAYPSLMAILGQDDAAANMPFSAGSKGDAGSSAFHDLDAATITQLVDNFLATNHPKNPIFVTDQLWARVHDVCETGLRWDGSTCLVLLICAISVLSPPFLSELQPGFSQQSGRLQRADHYFQMAQRRIGIVYLSNSLLAAQCGFLTAVYLMSTMRILAAWKAFAQAGTQCVGWLASRGHTGGSSDGQQARNRPYDNEQYMEESLYWSCLKSELELRVELGLPGSTLNEMQYTHVYPSPPSYEQLGLGHSSSIYQNASGWQQQTGTGSGDASTGTGTEKAAAQLERGWFFYLAEIALRRIMNEALLSRYSAGSWYYTTCWWLAGGDGGGAGGGGAPGGSGSGGSSGGSRGESRGSCMFRAHVDGFRQQLDTWTEMLPSTIQFPEATEKPTHDPLRGILRSHLVDILDVLYFPAVRAVVCFDFHQPGILQSGPGSVSETQESYHVTVPILSPYVLEAAREGVYNAVRRITITEEGFWHRHQGTWLMIRTCSRSLLLLLAVALRAHDLDRLIIQQQQQQQQPQQPQQQQTPQNYVAALLPDGWRHAVDRVLALLAYWEHESADVRLLRARVELILADLDGMRVY